VLTPKTAISEISTGLGMLQYDDIDAALAARPAAMRNVRTTEWDALLAAWNRAAHRDLFVASWMNGQAFLRASDALRGREPWVIEWKGPQRSVGDEAVPADLRIDHVYLVSCKYQSGIVINASPDHLFERLLVGGHGRRSGTNWFSETAPVEHAALYNSVRDSVDMPLPAEFGALSFQQRRALARSLRIAWPGDAERCYQALVAKVSEESAIRWKSALGANAERMLWRMLRIGSAPYFVLGASRQASMRLRVATPWDWRQVFELRSFAIDARIGGQPMVGWEALVRRKLDGSDATVRGHVEIRWSHGRLCGPPEAKVYLDTPHSEVPGYFVLD
jgi:hypothetical protein